MSVFIKDHKPTAHWDGNEFWMQNLDIASDSTPYTYDHKAGLIMDGPEVDSDDGYGITINIDHENHTTNSNWAHCSEWWTHDATFSSRRCDTTYARGLGWGHYGWWFYQTGWYDTRADYYVTMNPGNLVNSSIVKFGSYINIYAETGSKPGRVHLWRSRWPGTPPAPLPLNQVPEKLQVVLTRGSIVIAELWKDYGTPNFDIKSWSNAEIWSGLYPAGVHQLNQGNYNITYNLWSYESPQRILLGTLSYDFSVAAPELWNKWSTGDNSGNKGASSVSSFSGTWTVINVQPSTLFSNAKKISISGMVGSFWIGKQIIDSTTGGVWLVQAVTGSNTFVATPVSGSTSISIGDTVATYGAWPSDPGVCDGSIIDFIIQESVDLYFPVDYPWVESIPSTQYEFTFIKSFLSLNETIYPRTKIGYYTDAEPAPIWKHIDYFTPAEIVARTAVSYNPSAPIISVSHTWPINYKIHSDEFGHIFYPATTTPNSTATGFEVTPSGAIVSAPVYPSSDNFKYKQHNDQWTHIDYLSTNASGWDYNPSAVSSINNIDQYKHLYYPTLIIDPPINPCQGTIEVHIDNMFYANSLEDEVPGRIWNQPYSTMWSDAIWHEIAWSNTSNSIITPIPTATTTGPYIEFVDNPTPITTSIATSSFNNLTNGYVWGPVDREGYNNTITYSFYSFSTDFPEEDQKTVIRAALRTWADVIPVTFIEVEDNGLDPNTSSDPTNFPPFSGDIRFDLGGGIDGAGSILAWAGSLGGPAADFSGDIEFDDAEDWIMGYDFATDSVQIVPPTTGKSLWFVAVHELGHSLGFGHSSLLSSIMYPTYNYALTELHPDDILLAQNTYGIGKGKVLFRDRYTYPYIQQRTTPAAEKVIDLISPMTNVSALIIPKIEQFIPVGRIDYNLGRPPAPIITNPTLKDPQTGEPIYSWTSREDEFYLEPPNSRIVSSPVSNITVEGYQPYWGEYTKSTTKTEITVLISDIDENILYSVHTTVNKNNGRWSVNIPWSKLQHARGYYIVKAYSKIFLYDYRGFWIQGDYSWDGNWVPLIIWNQEFHYATDIKINDGDFYTTSPAITVKVDVHNPSYKADQYLRVRFDVSEDQSPGALKSDVFTGYLYNTSSIWNTIHKPWFDRAGIPYPIGTFGFWEDDEELSTWDGRVVRWRDYHDNYGIKDWEEYVGQPESDWPRIFIPKLGLHTEYAVIRDNTNAIANVSNNLYGYTGIIEDEIWYIGYCKSPIIPLINRGAEESPFPSWTEKDYKNVSIDWKGTTLYDNVQYQWLANEEDEPEELKDQPFIWDGWYYTQIDGSDDSERDGYTKIWNVSYRWGEYEHAQRFFTIPLGCMTKKVAKTYLCMSDYTNTSKAYIKEVNYGDRYAILAPSVPIHVNTSGWTPYEYQVRDSLPWLDPEPDIDELQWSDWTVIPDSSRVSGAKGEFFFNVSVAAIAGKHESKIRFRDVSASHYSSLSYEDRSWDSVSDGIWTCSLVSNPFLFVTYCAKDPSGIDIDYNDIRISMEFEKAFDNKINVLKTGLLIHIDNIEPCEIKYFGYRNVGDLRFKWGQVEPTLGKGGTIYIPDHTLSGNSNVDGWRYVEYFVEDTCEHLTCIKTAGIYYERADSKSVTVDCWKCVEDIDNPEDIEVQINELDPGELLIYRNDVLVDTIKLVGGKQTILVTPKPIPSGEFTKYSFSVKVPLKGTSPVKDHYLIPARLYSGSVTIDSGHSTTSSKNVDLFLRAADYREVITGWLIDRITGQRNPIITKVPSNIVRVYYGDNLTNICDLNTLSVVDYVDGGVHVNWTFTDSSYGTKTVSAIFEDDEGYFSCIKTDTIEYIEEKDNYVLTPVLDELPLTNDASHVILSGIAHRGSNVRIYDIRTGDYIHTFRAQWDDESIAVPFSVAIPFQWYGNQCFKATAYNDDGILCDPFWSNIVCTKRFHPYDFPARIVINNDDAITDTEDVGLTIVLSNSFYDIDAIKYLLLKNPEDNTWTEYDVSLIPSYEKSNYIYFPYIDWTLQPPVDENQSENRNILLIVKSVGELESPVYGDGIIVMKGDPTGGNENIFWDTLDDLDTMSKFGGLI